MFCISVQQTCLSLANLHRYHMAVLPANIEVSFSCNQVDWLQCFKQFFINVSYHILVASLTLMALKQSHQS